MSFSSNIRPSYFRVAEYGTYYYPAWKHYGNSNADVGCDRCGKRHLKACIGYSDQDLCLSCADDVTDIKMEICPGTVCSHSHGCSHSHICTHSCGCSCSSAIRAPSLLEEIRDRRDRELMDVCDHVTIIKK